MGLRRSLDDPPRRWTSSEDETDPFDPRTWGPTPDSYRIYLSDHDDSLFALVDAVDYEWASRHLWSFCQARMGRSSQLRKYYARRTCNVGGRRATVFLHKEVLLRAVGPHPRPEFTIGDHRNGDSLDCRRSNLRWATPSMNRRNLYGTMPYDLMEEHGGEL